MSDFITKLSELIDPEVMGDMVSARIPKKLRVAPFAKIDDTLQGVPGDTITVPAYTYIGDASDVAEGGEVAIEKMTTSTRKATIKKAMKGIGLTGEIGMIAGCRLVPSKKVPLAEGVYACPIVKLEADPEADDEIPALTIYRKREVNIETERKPKTRTTEITADEFYVAVLSNEAKVVLAKFKA